MTAVIENSTEIARSPEDVFDYLADVRNEPEWNPDCQWVRQLTEEPVGVGSRFRAKWKQSPAIETTLTELDRPRSWVYENGGPISLVLTITLEPTAARGTRLTAHGAWSAHGWMRLAFPVFVLFMRRSERQVLVNARRALEERRDQAPHAVVATTG
jgi:uncharacterized protein YndB with AHSA1/START domain